MKATAVIIILLCLFGQVSAGSYPSQGYIQNDSGPKCWYTQKTDKKSKHFFGIPHIARTLTFDDPYCMSKSEFGHEVNKFSINSVISRWYSHRDAAFLIRVSETRKRSLYQKRGRCIQSGTYPNLSIAVDYMLRKDSIVSVIHGRAVQGCTEQPAPQ